jgi:N-acetylneuraminic acid mutarotase
MAGSGWGRAAAAWVLGVALLAPAQAALSLADRIACQRAIEAVQWRHRGAASGTRLPFAQAVPPAVLRRRAEDAARQSAALAAWWDDPITPAQLQAELDRMAAASQAPAVLAELFAALGHDAERAAECLARPQLADRRLRAYQANDEGLHGALRRQARDALAAGRLDDVEIQQTTWVRGRPHPLPARALPFPPEVFDQRVAALRRSEGGRSGQVALGRYGRLHEDERRVYAIAIDALDADQVRLRTAVWRKAGFEAWWAARRGGLPDVLPADGHRYRLPAVAADATGCRDDSWRPTLSGLDGRYEHSAVWTGSEMIVWGGMEAVGFVYNDGARYNPATDAWTPVSQVGAPGRRHAHSAVWSGREMVVFGGDGTPTGGRYDPVTDTWRPTSVLGAPIGHQWSAMVWTGREMIVWGGILGSPTAAGARYDPQADSWRALPPSPLAPRAYMPAAWTGREMIVWSGYDVTRGRLYRDGARYDPASDAWTPMSTAGAPAATYWHTLVWTGSEAIAWGGLMGETAYGRYDPTTDTWRPLSLAGAPVNRYLHNAAWTGREMLVLGGRPSTAAGGRYDPATDTWTSMSTRNAPITGDASTMVWTGREALLWGGLDDNFAFRHDGGRYNPKRDRWRPMTTMNVPAPRGMHAAQWTGAEMIVWGGYGYALAETGARYLPATDTWSPISTVGQPAPRAGHTAVWTGTEILFWGAGPGDPFTPDSGGRYNPATDTWDAMSSVDAPFVTYGHSAVWTGREMITFGGISSSLEAKIWDAATNRWRSAARLGEAGHRDHHGAVWTGSEMIVWGGSIDDGVTPTGGRYDPVADRWTPTPVFGSPDARMWPVAAWTGSEALFWGGYDQLYTREYGDGARLDPVAARWTPMASAGAPSPRVAQGVWTGGELVLWGGENDSSGGRYDLAQDRWQATTLLRSPQVLWGGNWSTVWTGEQMLVWGGLGPTQKGALYCASGRPNEAPNAAGDAYVARSGRTLVVGTAAGLLANDSDPNGDPLNARLVSGPARGTLVLNPNGSFSYRSTAGYRGPDSFSYRANDDLADSASVTVSLDVR